MKTCKDGLPFGRYSVNYYSVRRGDVDKLQSADADVPCSYVEGIADWIKAHEVAVATCQSQPGWAIIAGSQRAMDAWDRAENAV